MDIQSFLIGLQAGKNAGGGGSSADVRYVTFMSYDGSMEYIKLPVAAGYDCPNPKIDDPTRESDVQYNYTFAGWATEPNGGLDSNALKAVNSNRTVYANFEAIVRKYTITYLDEDGSVLKTETLAYGATPSYVPTKEGFSFDKWNPAVTTVTGDASYTAVWAEKLKFSNATWADIAKVCESGQASEHFAVGDTRTIAVKWINSTVSKVNIDIEIIGINHDDLADGTGKAGITIGTKGAIYQYFFCGQVDGAMNSGWGSSNIRTKLNSTGLENLPTDMSQHIKEVTKLSKASNSNGSAVSSTDKLFVPSNTEFVGGTIYGSQYERYMTAENRKMYKIGKNGIDTSAYTNHYVRTPLATNNWVSYIDAMGNYVTNATENTQSVVCFCI